MVLRMLRTLVWKNALLQRRNMGFTLLEVVVPLIAALLVVLLNGLQTGQADKDIGLWKQTKDDSVPIELPTVPNATLLLHSEGPDEELVNRLKTKCKIREIKRVSASELDDQLSHWATNLSTQRIVATAVFHNSSGQAKVDLRVVNLFLTSEPYPPRGYNDSEYSFGYIPTTFVTLQYCLSDILPKQILFQRFPFPIGDPKVNWTASLPLVIGIGWLTTCILMVKRICDEIQNKCKQLLHNSGVGILMYWFHHFITNMAFMLLLSLVVSGLLVAKIGEEPIAKNSGYPLVFTFLFLYSASSIVFCMLFASVIRRTKEAIVTLVLCFVLFLMLKSSFVMHTSTPGFSSFNILRIVTFLIPNVALSDAVVVIQLGNAASNQRLATILAVMVVSIPFYAILVLLFDCEWSVMKLFKVKDGRSHPSGIQFEKVTKRFESGVLVLNNVSFEAKSNQITVILGGMGSGKSTIVDLLSGTVTQTSGDIVLNGCNTLTELESAHSNFRICFSYNVFYENLTVLENLRVFAGLHLPPNQARSEAFIIVNMLKLQKRRNDICKNLSFQTLRKLAVGIAVVGSVDRKTIVFDEPTFTLNNKDMKNVWNTLKKFAASNAVLVTTKSVDEAVNLANSLIVIREGITTQQAHQIPSYETYEKLLQFYFGFQKIAAPIPKQEQSATVTSQPLSLGTTVSQIFKIRWKYVSRNYALYLWHVAAALVLLSLFLLIEAFFVGQIRNADQNFNVTEKYGPSMALYLGSDTSAASNAYRQTSSQYGINVASVTNGIDKYFKEETHSPDIYTYKQRYLVGAQFSNEDNCASSDSSATAFYNREAPHSLPASLRMVFETIQRCDRGGANASINSLQVNSQQVSQKWLKYLFLPIPIRFYYASFFWIVVTFLVLFPFYFVQYVYVSKNYLLIDLSRSKKITVWIAYWLFDIAFQLSFAVLFIVVFTIHKIHFFYPYTILEFALILLLILFSIAFIPHVYSFACQKWKIIFLVIKCFIDGFVITHLMSFVLLTSRDTFSKIVFYILLIFAETSPIFTLVWALHKLTAVYYRLSLCYALSEAWKSVLCANKGPINDPFSSNEILRCCEETCSNDVCFVRVYYSPFTFGNYGIMLELIMLIVATFLGWTYIWITKVNEEKFNEQFEETSEKKIATGHTLAGTKITFRVKDADVVIERKNVYDTFTKNKGKDKAVVIKNLVKKLDKYALIDDISFEIQRGNVFGLLGIRGSGNETVIKIIATELSETDGTVIVNGYKTSEEMYNSQIGYSPEIPVLLSKLTVREIVMFYARIRGLANKDALSETEKVIEVMNIKSIADTVIEKLTWVQKKKVAIVVSFIGIPPVVLLESPFYGVDEANKQEMLTNIKKLQNRHNATVIIRSSQLDDCEPLCNRIAVMGLGQIRTIGTPQNLRAKFSKGYFVLLKISDNMEAHNSLEASVTRIMKNGFRNIVLLNWYQHMFHYHILDDRILKESVYKQLKPNSAIEDCSVIKASLENFIIVTFWIQTLFNKL